jgi:ribosomal protein S12 methylthiotransferase
MLREAEKLVEAGTKELLVISQDTSAYGVDIRHEPRMWHGRADRRPHDRPRARARPAPNPRSAPPGCASTMSIPYPHVDQVIPLMAEGLI